MPVPRRLVAIEESSTTLAVAFPVAAMRLVLRAISTNRVGRRTSERAMTGNKRNRRDRKWS